MQFYIRNRYKEYENIVWLLSGDSFPSVAGAYSQPDIFGTALAAADPHHPNGKVVCRSFALMQQWVPVEVPRPRIRVTDAILTTVGDTRRCLLGWAQI